MDFERAKTKIRETRDLDQIITNIPIGELIGIILTILEALYERKPENNQKETD